MAKLSIVKYPQKILRQRALEVREITPEVKKLISDMIEAMYANEGIGLAAPQIDISERIIIVETSDEPRKTVHDDPIEGKPIALLNPVIVKKSKETSVEEEGCLSLPGIFVPVKRSEEVEVICQTPEGDEVKIQAAGLIARIFQHEVDHLNGTLIIHRISPFRRLKVQKQLRALKRETG